MSKHSEKSKSKKRLHNMTSVFRKSTHSNDDESCSANTETTHPEKSVSFAQTVTVHLTLSLEDYSLDEIYDSFYGEDEYTKIRTLNTKQIDKINRGEILDHDGEDCERGFEKYTNDDAIICYDDRDFAIQLVLEQQTWQEDEDIIDEELLAAMYSKAASDCKSWACQLGVQDHEDVMAYYLEAS